MKPIKNTDELLNFDDFLCGFEDYKAKLAASVAFSVLKDRGYSHMKVIWDSAFGEKTIFIKLYEDCARINAYYFEEDLNAGLQRKTFQEHDEREDAGSRSVVESSCCERIRGV